MNGQMLLGIVLAIVAVLAIVLLYRFLKGRNSGKYVIKEEDKLHVTLESSDYGRVAEILLEGLGGKDNLVSSAVDGTRLKLMIRQYDAVDEKKLKSAGVGGVLRPSKTAVHIIIGSNAAEVKAALDSRLEEA